MFPNSPKYKINTEDFISCYSHAKKIVKDYLSYLGSSKQASNYDITDGFFVDHVKNIFNQGKDVSETFRVLVKANTDVWMPTLNISSDIDARIKEIEDK